MNKPKLTVLVGPPCSGKSTYSKDWLDNLLSSSDMARKIIINQDSQGKEHLKYFQDSLNVSNGTYDILIDRMNFNKQQRERYIKPAQELGYETEIIVFHESRETCIKRGMNRIETEHHGTINTKEDLYKAVGFFFSHYERPTGDEADTVTYKYPQKNLQVNAMICDLDNTLTNADHREHHLQNGKKNWKAFFDEMNKDPVNEWCKKIITSMKKDNMIVLSSGRPDNFKNVTETWLAENNIHYDQLSMRPRDDSRRDDIVKEIILHFEILTRYDVLFAIDDRKQVIDMLRRNNILVLDCAGDKGNF